MWDLDCNGQLSVILLLFFIVIAAFIAMAVAVLMLIAWWKICRKAGFSGWLALLMLVPAANLVLPLILAFMDWPVQQELRKLRQNRSADT